MEKAVAWPAKAMAAAAAMRLLVANISAFVFVLFGSVLGLTKYLQRIEDECELQKASWSSNERLLMRKDRGRNISSVKGRGCSKVRRERLQRQEAEACYGRPASAAGVRSLRGSAGDEPCGNWMVIRDSRKRAAIDMLSLAFSRIRMLGRV